MEIYFIEYVNKLLQKYPTVRRAIIKAFVENILKNRRYSLKNKVLNYVRRYNNVG